jgi:uncharacterized damage-inducible protein DinB
MSIAQSLLPEFDHEAANTRKLLARVPEAHASWKPHPKSWSLGELALHLANLPLWGRMTLSQPEIDMDSFGGLPKRAFTTTAALLETFDRNTAEERAALVSLTDADMLAPWTLRKGGKAVLTMPRVAAMRSSVLNHTIHHRGQLTVYLRMKDVPLPFLYGPTADEKA